MNVLVTGGSGQLGTLVLRRLVADQKVKRLVSLDLRPPMVASPRLETVTADIRDPDIGRHMAGCDALIHLAFVVTGHLPRDTFDAINVGGSRNVFTAAAAAGITRIVYSSSVAAYGVVPGHPVPIVETTPRVHQTDFPYASTKYEVEAFLDGFEKEHPELSVARLRPAILVGAHMEHALGDMLRRRVLLYTAGDVPMPLVWDEDVADAALLALRQGARGAFNLGADEPLPTPELARAAGFRAVEVPASAVRAFGSLSPLLARAGLGRPTDPAWLRGQRVPLVMSSEKAHTGLGWSPRCRTTAEVLRRYAEVVPGRLDPRLALFFRALTVAARRGPRDPAASARIHLQLTGPGGGDLGILIDRGHLAISRTPPRPPGSVVTLRASTLLDMLSGRTDVSSAQLTGEVLVEGDPQGGMALSGLVSTFKAQAAQPGIRGLGARAMARWLGGARP